MKPTESNSAKRERRDATMRIGAVEIVKRGVARYDFKDPYHFAIELSAKEFALAFLAAELCINTIFATLYFLSPGCIANMRPELVLRRLLFQHRNVGDRRLRRHGSNDLLRSRSFGHRDPLRTGVHRHHDWTLIRPVFETKVQNGVR